MSECSVYLIISKSPAPNGPWIRGSESSWRVCKVGISRHPYGRMYELQTASPHKLRVGLTWILPSRWQAEGVERTMHEVWAAFRLCGEWFFNHPGEIAMSIDAEIAYCAVYVWKWDAERYRSFLARNEFDTTSAKKLIEQHYGAEFAA